jgi:hypothetical protein
MALGAIELDVSIMLWSFPKLPLTFNAGTMAANSLLLLHFETDLHCCTTMSKS